jgi:hypothetical protein
VFGSLADRMADILRSRPSLTARIAFAPPQAVHAVAAFMYLAPEASGSDKDVGDLIEQSDPRDILRMALPDCPARLYRALDRAGNSARDRSYYARLDAVCRGPFGSAFLDGDLSDTRLDYYEALPTMDPLIANLRTALPEVRHLASAVDTLVALLRGYGVIDKCDLDLPRSARTGAVLRRLLRGLYAVQAPQPPFTLPEPFRLVETIGELRDIGRKFKNCLANVVLYGPNHWLDLANGAAVYLLTEEPHLLTELRGVGPNLWHIDQMTGPRNAAPSPALRQSLEQKLRDAGIRLVDVSPSYAISDLDRAARPRKPGTADRADDFDDFDD